jgi:predicted acylesterase/phospholipase RssA
MTSADQVPELECDVVMKGGITSGVIYPAALVELGSRYRFRGLGGTSAGAIGAAVGAAAELGRDRGGFDAVAALPASLGDGALGELFQPQHRTAGLLRLLFAYLRSGWSGVLLATLRTFPVASLVGIAPGATAAVVGVLSGGPVAVLLAAAGVVLAVVGWLLAIGVRLHRIATVDLPANLFGAAGRPGFTDWLADAVDDAAGLPAEHRPLLFGDLWSGEVVRPVGPGGPMPADPVIDLRMITTCLSHGRPYELPMKARTFFYDEETWATLFPAPVMAALRAGSPDPGDPATATEQAEWLEALAGRHGPRLRRLPEPQALPVIVATRLSLSFPGLISAVPLWDIDFSDTSNRAVVAEFRAARDEGRPRPASGIAFRKVWFSDGGLCSNFPVHFFDGALTTRPTFAINLGSFPVGREPLPDERDNIELARTNEPLPPAYDALPERGLGALTGFAGLAVGTARNWSDSSHLQFPGYRDRIVKVFQTDREGGLNLDMAAADIERLGTRGRAAAEAVVEQFGTDRYAPPTATGWDNHRWVRYRAFLACLPAWLSSYARGRSVLDIDPTAPPSYRFGTAATRELAAELSVVLDEAARLVHEADPAVLADLTGEPNPEGVIRRVPRT